MKPIVKINDILNKTSGRIDSTYSVTEENLDKTLNLPRNNFNLSPIKVGLESPGRPHFNFRDTLGTLKQNISPTMRGTLYNGLKANQIMLTTFENTAKFNETQKGVFDMKKI